MGVGEGKGQSVNPYVSMGVHFQTAFVHNTLMFLWKKYNFIHFERQNCLSKCVQLYLSRKKIIKKMYVCLPYLKVSDPLPETLLFLLGPIVSSSHCIDFSAVVHRLSFLCTWIVRANRMGNLPKKLNTTKTLISLCGCAD